MGDELYIARCLQLAAMAQGNVAPNPMVGAVLVYQERIIGEGWHQQYGAAHAEVNCFENVKPEDRHLIPQSTLYVSLEPCAHYGKTPPCAQRIVKEAVKRVVICNQDPFEQVAGRGIQILKDKGIELSLGIDDAAGAWLNRRFFTFHQKRRPYIILKWAQTASGLFAPKDTSRFQMSDAYSQRLSHQWRREEAAILVGTRTAINDNPQLIARYGSGKQALRIVLDTRLQLPATHHLLAQPYPTWLLNWSKEGQEDHLQYVQLDRHEALLPQLMKRLYEAQINSLIVEGGAHLLQQFIDAALWDEARVFQTPNVLQEGIAAPVLKNEIQLRQLALAQDQLFVYASAQNNYVPAHQDAFIYSL